MKIIKFIIAIPSTLIYLVFSGIIISGFIFGSVAETEDNIPTIQVLKLLFLAFFFLFSSVILMLWGLDKIKQWLYSFAFITIPFGLLICSLLNVTKIVGIWITFAIVISIFLIVFFSVKKYYKT
jgi:O-antigen/teichoic acid export membrane protein